MRSSCRLLVVLALAWFGIGSAQSALPSLIPKAIPAGFVLLHRVGEPHTSSGDNGGGSDAELDIARSVWLDVVDRFSGNVTFSIPWPVKSSARGGVQHWSCVQSLRSSSLFQLSTDSRSIVGSCADATPLVDRIPSKGDGSERAVPWVLTRMAADGIADTRTLLVPRNNSRCAHAWPTSTATSVGDYFVVSTISLPAAPDPTACPLMVVPWGNQGGGEWVPNAQLYNVTAMHIIFQNLLLFDARPGGVGYGFAELGRAAQSQPPVGANLVRRFVSVGDMAPGTYPQVPLAYLPDSIEIAPNPDNSYYADDGKMGWAVDSRPGITNSSLFVYELAANISCCSWAQTREYAAPDGRPIVSVTGVPAITSTAGQPRVTVFNERLYIVTALTANATWPGGPPAGSTLYEFNLPAARWRQLAVLPCCGAMWRSVIYPPGAGVGMSAVAFASSPTAQPLGGVSDSPQPTVSPSASSTHSRQPSRVSNVTVGAGGDGAASAGAGGASGGSMSTAAIAGVATAAALLLASGCCCVVIACRYRRFRGRTRRRNDAGTRASADTGTGAGTSESIMRKELAAGKASASRAAAPGNGKNALQGVGPRMADATRIKTAGDDDQITTVDAQAAEQLSALVADAPQSAQQAAAALAGAVAASLQLAGAPGSEPASVSSSRRGSGAPSAIPTRASVVQAVSALSAALQRAIAQLQAESASDAAANESSGDDVAGASVAVAVTVASGDAGGPELASRSPSSPPSPSFSNTDGTPSGAAAARRGAGAPTAPGSTIQRTLSPGRRARADVGLGASSPSQSRGAMPEALLAARCMQREMEPLVLGRIASAALRSAQSVLLRGSDGPVDSERRDSAAAGTQDAGTDISESALKRRSDVARGSAARHGRASRSGAGAAAAGAGGHRSSVLSVHEVTDVDELDAWLAEAAIDAEEGGFDAQVDAVTPASSTFGWARNASAARRSGFGGNSSASASALASAAPVQRVLIGMASAGQKATLSAAPGTTSSRALGAGGSGSAAALSADGFATATLSAPGTSGPSRMQSQRHQLQPLPLTQPLVSPEPVIRNALAAALAAAVAASTPLPDEEGSASSRSRGGSSSASSGDDRHDAGGSVAHNPMAFPRRSTRTASDGKHICLTAQRLAADPDLAQRLTRAVVAAALQASRQTVSILQEARQRQLHAQAAAGQAQPTGKVAGLLPTGALDYYYSPTAPAHGSLNGQMAARPSLSTVFEKHSASRSRRRKRSAGPGASSNTAIDDDVDFEYNGEDYESVLLRIRESGVLPGFLAFAAWQVRSAAQRACPCCCRAADRRRLVGGPGHTGAALAGKVGVAGKETGQGSTGGSGAFFISNTILAGRSAAGRTPQAPPVPLPTSHHDDSQSARGKQAPGAPRPVHSTRGTPDSAGVAIVAAGVYQGRVGSRASGTGASSSSKGARDAAVTGDRAAGMGMDILHSPSTAHRLSFAAPSSGSLSAGALQHPSGVSVSAPFSPSGMAPEAKAVGAETGERGVDDTSSSPGPRRLRVIRPSGPLAGDKAGGLLGLGQTARLSMSMAASPSGIAGHGDGGAGAKLDLGHAQPDSQTAAMPESQSASAAEPRRRLQRAGSIGTVSSRNVLRASLTRMGSAAVLTASVGAPGAASASPPLAAPAGAHGVPAMVRRSPPGSPTGSRRF